MPSLLDEFAVEDTAHVPNMAPGELTTEHNSLPAVLLSERLTNTLLRVRRVQSTIRIRTNHWNATS